MNVATIRLARAYFHQDYQDEANEPIELVEMFRDNEPGESVDALRAEIASWLESEATEDDLSREWLDVADSYYDPRVDDLTMRQWLHQIVDVLDKKADPTASEADVETAESPVARSAGTGPKAPTDASPPTASRVEPPSDQSPGIPFKRTSRT